MRRLSLLAPPRPDSNNFFNIGYHIGKCPPTRGSTDPSLSGANAQQTGRPLRPSGCCGMEISKPIVQVIDGRVEGDRCSSGTFRMPFVFDHEKRAHCVEASSFRIGFHGGRSTDR